MELTKENYKELDWNEMTPDDDYYDFVHSLDQEEQVTFLKFILEKHPEYDDEWIQVYFDIVDEWRKKGEWDKINAFADFVREKSPEVHKKEFQYLDDEPVLHALFQEDLELVKIRFAETVSQPVKAVDSSLKTVFNILSTNRQYNEYTKEIAEKVWKPLRDSEKLIGGAEENYVLFLYCSKLASAFDTIKAGAQVDWESFKEDLETINFRLIEPLTELPNIDGQIPEPDKFHKEIAYREEFRPRIFFSFLYYAHVEADIPIYWAFRAWMNINGYMLEEEDAPKRKNWFAFTPAMLDKLGSRLVGFMGGNRAEMYMTFWTIPYLYDFFLKQEYIDEPTHQRLMEYYQFSKRRILEGLGSTFWKYKGVYTWKRPQYLSEAEELQEKKLMLDSINWTREEGKETIQQYLNTLPELPSYVVPPRVPSMFERMRKQIASESNASLKNASFKNDSPKIGGTGPKRIKKKRKKKHVDNRKKGARKKKRK